MLENTSVVRAKVWYGHSTIREQAEISRRIAKSFERTRIKYGLGEKTYQLYRSLAEQGRDKEIPKVEVTGWRGIVDGSSGLDAIFPREYFMEHYGTKPISLTKPTD